MKYRIYSFLLAVGLLFASSCDMDKYLENPNQVSESAADPNFLLNRIQLDFVDLFNVFSLSDQRLTRIQAQAGLNYETAYRPQSFDGRWTNAYANILADIKLMKKLATERNLNRHLSIAKTIEAFTLMILVDHFNAVPYSEALDPNNFNPKVDDAASVYAAALKLLDEAGQDFKQPNSVGSPNDFFYANNYGRWYRLVNSLKLRYHLNLRLVNASASTAAINALIQENQLITSDADNFIFRYSTNAANPDSRHPDFSANYISGASGYQSNFYMWHLTEAKGIEDPRVRYYLYRQTNQLTTDVNELRCLVTFPPAHYANFVFCYPNDRGYWGRDHLDNAGIPPDGLKRTIPGLYPAGGKFDNNQNRAGNINDGNRGAGIEPIMIASFVRFMLAEAALTLGTTGDPKTLLEEAIRASMGFVRSFALSSQDAANVTAIHPNTTFNNLVNNYVNLVKTQYDQAATPKDKMRVIAREYWLALYGNGLEAYNLYRRTGQPDRMQPGLIPEFGNFPRTYYYPSAFVNRNRNVDQREITERVFWDTNPAGNSWVY